MLDLNNFQRPQRYIGNEWNVIKKDHDGKITFCLAYPDIYEIGMSNLGLRIVYGLLNNDSDIVCERVFMPGLEMVDQIRKNPGYLFSLESKTCLREFEIIGFNMGHELNYTNFLKMLELGDIDIFAAKRDRTMVIASGISNPEPLAQFVDVFFIGEFEDSCLDFCQTIKKYKSKSQRLEALAAINGFYVPAFYENNLTANGYTMLKKNQSASWPVERVYTRDFEESYVPVNWLTPHTGIAHDRVPIEIARGCPNRCTFCQARSVYYPYRERSPGKIKEILEKTYAASGYQNFSLLGLSISQHSRIEEIIDNASAFCQKHAIGLSLPSLRLDDLLGPLQGKLEKLRKTSLTLAIEAADQTLRQSLDKTIDISKLFQAARFVKTLGARHIKLYFMYGFANEGEGELLEIGYLLKKLLSYSKISLHVSINIFIPKPFSRWEAMPLQDQSTLEKKKTIMQSCLPRGSSVKIALPDYRRTLVEALLSRGDRKVGDVIYRAYSQGALFDGYGECFSWQIWAQAIEESGISPNDYTSRRYASFPWSFIQSSGCARGQKDNHANR